MTGAESATPAMPAPSGAIPPGMVLQVEGLSLAYPAQRGRPPVQILRNLSVDVRQGSSLTVVGPSGSGKSSFLRCLNRLEEPTSGLVRFGGRDIRSLDPRELRRRAALVPQSPVLFDGTVRDNLRAHPAAARMDLSETRLTRNLGEVGLDAALLDRDGATLSGGEKQRVTIARALLADPEALLLDEPTSALDPPNATLVIQTISRLRAARGLTIVVVTHQPELIRRLGGFLLYLVRGEREAYECLDASLAPVLTDARLEAFLAGAAPAAVTRR